MAHHISAGPPGAIANFGNVFAPICEVCGSFRQLCCRPCYLLVTQKSQVSTHVADPRCTHRGKIDASALSVSDDVCERSNSAVRQIDPNFSVEPGRVRGPSISNLSPAPPARLESHPQRLGQKLWKRGQIVLDNAPVHRVVDVVEQVDVGEANRKMPDLVGVVPGTRAQVPLPAQSHVRGLLQPCRKSSAMRAGPCVSRLMLIQKASIR